MSQEKKMVYFHAVSQRNNGKNFYRSLKSPKLVITEYRHCLISSVRQPVKIDFTINFIPYPTLSSPYFLTSPHFKQKKKKIVKLSTMRGKVDQESETLHL